MYQVIMTSILTLDADKTGPHLTDYKECDVLLEFNWNKEDQASARFFYDSLKGV